MKLYASHTSPYARLAIISAYRVGYRRLQLEFVLPWENPAELIAVNPFCQVPVLQTDDGNTITDSLIITHYLDETTQSGGRNCAVTSFAFAAINQCVKAFSLEKDQPQGTTAHPHIERAKQALARALPRAPQLIANSENWAQIVLGNAFCYIKRRAPELYETHVSQDNKIVAESFIQRDFMRKTEPEALAKNPATIAEL